MIRFEFVVEEHKEYGMTGLRPKWMPDGDPLTGMATAHDCLEHVPESCRVGFAPGEFMALGAAVWIRAGGGYWANKGSPVPPESHLASDFPDILTRVEIASCVNGVIVVRKAIR